MGQQIEALAALVAQTNTASIPSAVREHAKLVFLDTLGVILAGSVQPAVMELRRRLGERAGSGATVLAHGWPAMDPRTASLLNGTAGRSIELCEGHRFVTCQAAVQVLPAVLATAEWVRASGADILGGLVLGYDVSVRLGAGLRARPLAHQNGQTALIGAAAAGARLRGMNAGQVSLAMRIASTFVVTPSYTNAVAGATTLNAAGGMSGLAGTLAPEMALSGYVAQDEAIEESLGQLTGDGFDPARVVEELGMRWEITRNSFRLRACCNPIYASLDAIEAGLAELQPQAGDIERIDVETFAFAAAMRSQDPHNGFASKYSLPHVAAAIVVLGTAGYEATTEQVVNDPAIAALRRRVFVKEDPALTARWPTSKPGRATIVLKDGRRVTHEVESARGDFQRPYAPAEIRGKFHELAQKVLTPEGSAAVEQAVDRVEQWTGLDELTELLRRHTRR
jgi:2-methylcitrate dehydratase PrpD